VHTKSLHIVLIGNPNTGKTSLFNTLTGSNQKVSNLPGTTVEEKKGFYVLNDEIINVTDLPGIYSLYPKSNDERLSVEYLIEYKDCIDKIVFVADASNLARNLLLLSQVADLGIPIIIALNMLDMAYKKSLITNIESLSKELGIIICPINGRNGEGIKNLNANIQKQNNLYQTTFFNPTKEQLWLIDQEKSKGTYYFRWLKTYLKYASNVKDLLYINPVLNENIIAEETTYRFDKIEQITNEVQTKRTLNAKTVTYKLDNILLHPIWGFVVFFSVLFFLFQSVFRIADYPMQWIEHGFAFSIEQLKNLLPAGGFNNLLTDGIIPGISGIIVFLPQIIILFLILALLEDSGYMTRVSFITDRLMRKFGLNGKSVIPLIGSMACAIPSIMATRNIDNKKDRLITILVTPLMSCSARLPVYTLLASLLVVNTSFFGLDFRGLLMLCMYILGFIAAMLFALLFKWILKQKEKSFFVLELPDYRLPRWRNIAITLKDKIKDFVWNAGKIIFAVSILLWFLANYAPQNAFERIDQKYQNYSQADKNEKIQSEKLEASYAGILGKTIEPAIKPLGYDWKIGIALITSFAAREVFVGTVATIYSVGSTDDEQVLSDTLKKQKNADGSILYTPAVILSLLVFYAFAMQCISTLAVTYRETKSYKWPVVQFIYMSSFAYLMSFMVYNIFK
jgi:ferrous iron transport protein B